MKQTPSYRLRCIPGKTTVVGLAILGTLCAVPRTALAAPIFALLTADVVGMSSSMIGRGIAIGDPISVGFTYDSSTTAMHSYNANGELIRTLPITSTGFSVLADGVFDFSSNIDQAFATPVRSDVILPAEYYGYFGAVDGSDYLAFWYQGSDLYFHVTVWQHGGVFRFSSADSRDYIVSDIMAVTFTDHEGTPIATPGIGSPIPEPGSLFLLGTGVAGIVARSVRRKKQRAVSIPRASDHA